jgi:hypothetical protein
MPGQYSILTQLHPFTDQMNTIYAVEYNVPLCIRPPIQSGLPGITMSMAPHLEGMRNSQDGCHVHTLEFYITLL